MFSKNGAKYKIIFHMICILIILFISLSHSPQILLPTSLPTKLQFLSFDPLKKQENKNKRHVEWFCIGQLPQEHGPALGTAEIPTDTPSPGSVDGKASWLGLGLCPLPFLMLESCACCHSLWEFIWRTLFPWSHPWPLAPAIFLPSFHVASRALGLESI